MDYCGSPSWKIKQIKFQVRSISLPARSHPSTLKIEQDLARLHSSFASNSSSVASLVAQLGQVYTSLEQLLHMPSTHQLLTLHHRRNNYNYMDHVLQGSMEMLDVCGILRDTVFQIKEQLQALQSELRRCRKADEAAVLEYSRFRKKIRKEMSIVKVVSSLKQMGNKLLLPTAEQDDDHHLVAVIRVLREVNVLSISAFQSVSSFLSSEPSRPTTTTTRWLSRLVGMEKSNELESVDASLCKLHPISNNHGTTTTTVQKQLEELETTIRDIEEALNDLIRRMIKSRASLLNIISQ